MKIGVSTASLFLRALNEDAASALAGLGIRTAEVFLATFSEYGREFGRLIRSRAGNMELRSVHSLTTHFEPQLYSGHPRARADAFAVLDLFLDAAEEMGAAYYTFHGTSRLKKVQPKTDYAAVGEKTEIIRARCAARGVALCYENVEWANYAYPGFFRELKKYCPGILGVLDIKQARLSGYPVGDYIDDMAGSIATVHVSDTDERGRMCLPGRGRTDFRELFARLKDAGFDGAVLIEAYKDDFGSVRELRESADYLSEIAGL